MSEIEAANKTETGDLYQGTYKHIKVTLSALFTFAKRKGIHDGVNPITGVSIPKDRKHGRKRLANTLEEIEENLALFSGTEPLVIDGADCPYAPEVKQGVVRAVIAVAAFAGLRHGEIRGLWWEDDEGDLLNIRRSVWRTHLKYEPKTHEDEEDPGVVSSSRGGWFWTRLNPGQPRAGCSRTGTTGRSICTISPNASSSRCFVRVG